MKHVILFKIGYDNIFPKVLNCENNYKNKSRFF